MSPRPRVAVCAGKSCRRHEAYGDLLRDLGGVADVVTVRCLDVCDSPVVVVGPDTERPIVLRKVRKRKQRRDLIALARGEPITARLREREVRRKRRRKALDRLVRALRTRPPAHRATAS